MTLKELEKYVGHYVSFDYAVIPIQHNNPDVDTRTHIEGTLEKNNGRLSHFAIKESDMALRDDFVGLIINFRCYDIFEEIL